MIPGCEAAGKPGVPAGEAGAGAHRPLQTRQKSTLICTDVTISRKENFTMFRLYVFDDPRLNCFAVGCHVFKQRVTRTHNPQRRQLKLLERPCHFQLHPQSFRN